LKKANQQQALMSSPDLGAIGAFNAGLADGAERREHARRTLRVHAKMLLPNKTVVAVRTIDIGAGGMGVSAPQDLRSGTAVAVQVQLPNPSGGERETLLAQATVTHSVLSAAEQGFKIGLRFSLSDSATAVLMRYLKQYS
jgi:PilZ domain